MRKTFYKQAIFIWLSIFCIFWVLPVSAGVIFEDNFDSHADWHPSPGTNIVSPQALYECTSGNCSSSVPNGWSFTRIQGWWWPPSYHDGLIISNENHRGNSGKALTSWEETKI